jgi:hypothetical protein
VTTTIDAAQRRARLAHRHRLLPGTRVTSPEAVADALVVLHATDPASVFLAVAARTAPEVTPTAIEEALYARRTLRRMHGMRRTIFVVPDELVTVVSASSSRKIAIRQRELLRELVVSGGFDDAWLDQVEREAVAALAELGEVSAAELGAAVPAFATQITVAAGKPYEAKQGVGSRLLTVLGMEDRVVRGRPLGGWTAGQYRWSAGDERPAVAVAEAQAELVRRWLAAFGPATEDDLIWWTGWTVGDVRKALAAGATATVDLDGAAGIVLADDLEPVAEPEPWAALLPALDPTAMGYKHRDWYLPPEHRPALFDRTGNVGPTVWWNGRVVGGWAVRPDGAVAWRALEPLGGDATRAIEVEAERLHGWLGGTVVKPRFRTPLERELSG